MYPLYKDPETLWFAGCGEGSVPGRGQVDRQRYPEPDDPALRGGHPAQGPLHREYCAAHEIGTGSGRDVWFLI